MTEIKITIDGVSRTVVGAGRVSLPELLEMLTRLVTVSGYKLNGQLVDYICYSPEDFSDLNNKEEVNGRSNNS